MGPAQRCCDVVDLVGPPRLRLEPIVDNRDSDAASRIEAAEVAVNVVATHSQVFVAVGQRATVKEDEQWPTVGAGAKKVEPVLLLVGLFVCTVGEPGENLASATQLGGLVEGLDGYAHYGRAARENHQGREQFRGQEATRQPSPPPRSWAPEMRAY